MDIVREFDMIAWISSCMIAFFFSLLAHRRWWAGNIKQTDKRVSDNIITWIFFIFLTGFGNLFGMINRLYIAKIYGFETFQYLLMDKISVTLDITAITIKVYNIESTMRFLKRNYFTFINIFVIIFNWFIWNQVKNPDSIASVLLLLFQAIGFLFLPMLYIVIACKTSGSYRRDALRLLFGVLLIEMALTLQAHNIEIIFEGFTLNFLAIFKFPFQIITPMLVSTGFLLLYRGITDLLET